MAFIQCVGIFHPVSSELGGQNITYLSYVLSRQQINFHPYFEGCKGLELRCMKYLRNS